LISPDELEQGYHWAYREFYTWSNIIRSSAKHDSIKHMMKHFMYSGGWKKFEPLWNFIIKTRNLRNMLPLLESVLAKVDSSNATTTGKAAALYAERGASQSTTININLNI
jgi:hypothetical protein